MGVGEGRPQQTLAGSCGGDQFSSYRCWWLSSLECAIQDMSSPGQRRKRMFQSLFQQASTTRRAVSAAVLPPTPMPCSELNQPWCPRAPDQGQSGKLVSLPAGPLAPHLPGQWSQISVLCFLFPSGYVLVTKLCLWLLDWIVWGCINKK